MTLIASILFLSALAAAVFAITTTFANAMPRIRQVIEDEFAPQERVARVVTFGPVRQRYPKTSEVLVFPLNKRVELDFRLAA